MAYTAQQLQAAADQAFADPAVQQAWQAWQDFHAKTGVWSDAHGVGTYERDLQQKLHAAGMPTDMRLSFGGSDGAPHFTNPGLPGWAYPLIAAGIAVTAGAATGAFSAAPALAGGIEASAPASGMIPGATAALDAWPGTAAALPAVATGTGLSTTVPASTSALAPAAATAAAPPAAGAASSVNPWLRYGLPTAAGAAQGYLANKNARQQQQQQVAFQESTQDPFRGTMNQAADIATLEHMGQGPRSYAPVASSPYAKYFNPANAAPPLSDPYRATAANAQQLVASGQGRVPTMTDPKNWGNPGTSDLTTPGAPPLPTSTTPPSRTRATINPFRRYVR